MERMCCRVHDGANEAAVEGLPASAPFNVMLTCYTLFERDSEEQRIDRDFLRKWRWSHMVDPDLSCGLSRFRHDMP